MFGYPTPHRRKRNLSAFLRAPAAMLLLPFIIHMVPRMSMLNSNSNAILEPLLQDNDLFTTCLKAITSSRFTAAGGIVVLIYTILVIVPLIFVRGWSLLIISVFDFIMTIVIAAAVGLTASYTPLDAQVCQSIRPESAGPKTVLYARLYSVSNEDGASNCTMTMAFVFVGFGATALYAIITAVTLARAIRHVRAQKNGDQEHYIGEISEPILPTKPAKPTQPSVSISLLAVPEPSAGHCSHQHHCCDTSYHPTSTFEQHGSGYQPAPTSDQEDTEEPPPYEENDHAKKNGKDKKDYLRAGSRKASTLRDSGIGSSSSSKR